MFAYMRRLSIRCLLFAHKQDNGPYGATFENFPSVTPSGENFEVPDFLFSRQAYRFSYDFTKFR